MNYKTVPYSGKVTLDDLRPNTNYSAKVRLIQQVDGLDIYSAFSDETVTFAVDRDETIGMYVCTVVVYLFTCCLLSCLPDYASFIQLAVAVV